MLRRTFRRFGASHAHHEAPHGHGHEAAHGHGHEAGHGHGHEAAHGHGHEAAHGHGHDAHGHGHGHHHPQRDFAPPPEYYAWQKRHSLKTMDHDGPGGYTSHNNYCLGVFLSSLAVLLSYKWFFVWNQPIRRVTSSHHQGGGHSSSSGHHGSSHHEPHGDSHSHHHSEKHSSEHH